MCYTRKVTKDETYRQTQNGKKVRRDYQRQYMRSSRKQSPEKINTYEREYRRRLRAEVMDMLGGPICAECKCTKQNILEINHKKGKGRQEMKSKSPIMLHRDILKGRVPASDCNVLCRVCNTLHYVRDILGIKGHKITFGELA